MKDKKSAAERAAWLVGQMTLEEKVMQAVNLAAAIPRLGVPAYNYWNEASHGVNGIFKAHRMDVTIFPVCLALSQSWNQALTYEVASVISDEARTYYNRHGDELHLWCPTVNLTRDPRWGRNDESFGEDPYLAGKLAAAYVRGIQDERDGYVKAISTPKHFALNNSEGNRTTGSSDVDEATLREYYCKVFEYTIKEGHAQSIMTSYNRINGIPASANVQLLTTMLRKEWGFDGFVVSDCGAVEYAFAKLGHNGKPEGHWYVKSLEEASAITLKAGLDMACGILHAKGLLDAYVNGYIDESDLDRALIRVFTSRYRLGTLDKTEQTPYHEILTDANTPKHQKIAEKAARESIVLLKNENGILPINKKVIKKIAVIGPNALYNHFGGYSAGNNGMIHTVINTTYLEGILAEASDGDIQITYSKGWNFSGVTNLFELLPGAEDTMEQTAEEDVDGVLCIFQKVVSEAVKYPERFPVKDMEKGLSDDVLMEKALTAASEADMVIVVAGTDAGTASEESDRATLQLPYAQDEKLLRIIGVNPNTIVICETMGPVTGAFLKEAPAILAAPFLGQAKGQAMCDVLFGRYNPSARLTQTWYLSDSDLPPITQYGIRPGDTDTKKGRTYQYFRDAVAFPFGYGLNYTTFEYQNFEINNREFLSNETVEISFDVINTGKQPGVNIVQLYVKKLPDTVMSDHKPDKQLKGYVRTELLPGEKQRVALKLPVSELLFWNNFRGRYTVDSGQYCVWLAESAADSQQIIAYDIFVDGNWEAKLGNVWLEIDKPVIHVGDMVNAQVSAVMEDCSVVDLKSIQPRYSSHAPHVAAINSEGQIRALSTGTALITAELTLNGVTKVHTSVIAVV